MVCVCVPLLAVLLVSQQNDADHAVDVSDNVRATSQLSEPGGDPTSMGSKLQSALNLSSASKVKNAAAPRITKRAFIDVENHAPEAVIELEGLGLITIVQGSSIPMTLRTGTSVTFRVVRLTAELIEIEIPGTGQVLTIR